MSSSFGPYKSRLFNFLNRQAIALNSNLGKTVRNLKVAATWGVQILLYPLYLVVQTGRWAQRQLEHKFEEIKYQLPKDIKDIESITTDQVLCNVLEEVELSFGYNLENYVQESVKDINNNSLVKINQNNQFPAIQEISKIHGIACLLDNKNLVLVAKNNEIIDILNSEQQHKLEQLIIWNITQYFFESRHKIKKMSSSLPLITTNNVHVISPIRWFWQVMGWLQVRDVARGINLFGESNLSYYPQEDHSTNVLNFSIHNRVIIKKLDRTIANFEGELIMENDMGETPSILQDQGDFLQEEDPFQIQILILAAIDYFFGGKNKQKNALKTQLNQNKLTQSNSELLKNEPDPWLSWSDLSNHKNEGISTEIEDEKSVNLINGSNPQSLPQLPRLPHRLIKLFSATLKKTTIKPKIETKNKQNYHHHHQEIDKELVLTTFNNNNQELAIVTDSKNIEAKADWLETDAKHIGYVKNLLEIVLEGLDKCILWLEEMVLFIVNLISKIFKN